MTPPLRTKTFTGCWTCRTRKIKCDLTRPKCVRCTKANVECEGYSIKLRWSSSTKTDRVEPEDAVQRRHVGFVEYPPDMIYETYDDLDLVLAKLHSPKFSSTDETVVLGPFGVFEGIKRPRARRGRKRRQSDSKSTPSQRVKTESAEPTPLSISTTPQSKAKTPGEDDSIIVTPASCESVASANNVPVSGFVSYVPDEKSEYEALHEELSTLLHADSFASDSFHSQFLNNNFMADLDLSQTNPFLPQQLEPQQQFQSERKPSSPSFLFVRNHCEPPKYALPHGNLKLNEMSLSFSPQGQYLLDYYDKNVIKIMSVVAHPKNPWRTIYLPRAFTAIGDTIGRGYTSAARNALLHALLAVSAFHLQSKFPDGSPAKEHYLELGQKLKTEAYSWLSICLMNDLATQKYKDVVVAVLSMVTIDVIWGGMSDCQIHLAACQSVVNMRHRTRKRTSRKAQILQTISGFLTLLQKSTVVDPDSVLGLCDEEDDDNDQWLDLRLEDLDLGNKRRNSYEMQSTLSYMSDPSQFVEYCHQYSDENATGLSDDFYDKELVSTQSLYGIPDSLILLFNQACKLSRQALHYRTKGTTFSKSFSRQCAELEAALVSWQTRYDINKTTNFTGHIKAALNHHTLAFHESLIIYHYRLARDINLSALRPHVLAVVEHFEEMQRINALTPEPLIIPLLFPAFIAACETVQDDDIQRCRTILEKMTVEGLGTYYAAMDVIKEVWRRKAETLPNADWWSVVRERNANIMLS